MKKIVVLGLMDGFANAEKPREIKKFLEANGHQVMLINTTKIQRITITDSDVQYRESPNITIFNLALHPFIRIRELWSGSDNWFVMRILFIALWFEIRLRAAVLWRIIKKLDCDLLICESQLDSHLLHYPIIAKTWYDCATPWADELYYGHKITKWEYSVFLKDEISVYEQADYLSFHWSVLGDYVKKYFYHGKNLIKLNAGTHKKNKQATYSSTPKIAYLGFLGGYWINLPLLSRLAKLYPHIDVYGAPAPDPSLGLNYKGYASPEVLAEYQFGLITISDDRLRSEGFSAKHIEYLSYGLPVLMPDWRTSAKEFHGTLPFNEENFLEIIKKHSTKTEWSKISSSAKKQADELSWEQALHPLLEVVTHL